MFGWFWPMWLRRKRPRDQEIEEELNYHLDMLAKEQRPGVHGEAEYSARRTLGNKTQIQEATRSVWIQIWLEALVQDLKYALRTLRKNPGYTAAAVLSLALGIGANTALFQLLNALVLRSLPVKDPQNLVRINYAGHPGRTGNFWHSPNDFTNSQWEQIRRHGGPFQGMFAWGPGQFNLAQSGEVRYARGIYVSGGFFRVLEVDSQVGRVFSEKDDQRGCAATAVISDGFAQREFGDSKSALGRELRLNGHGFNIIGVTEPGFTGIEVGEHFDVAVPICAQPTLDGPSVLDNRRNWWLGMMGRLKPGVSKQGASAYLDSIWPAILKETVDPSYRPDTVKDYLKLRIQAEPGSTGFSSLRREAEDPLLLLLSIAGLVLLIACANLANLLLARAAVREGEIGVRLAVGASRLRIIRQLMSESLLLALFASVIGISVAQLLSRYLLTSFATSGDPLFLNLSLDWLTLLFVGGLIAIACLLFGLIPALRATDRDLSSTVKTSRRNLTGTRKQFGLQNLLVAAQISLSLILLVGSFLFVRSFRNLMTLDPGFRQNGLLAVWLTLNNETVVEAQRSTLFQRMLDDLRTTPGIESAAIVDFLPMSGDYSNDRITLDNSKDREATDVTPKFNKVSDGYFQTLNTPLVAGRDFNLHDTPSSPPVAIVDQMFTTRFLHGQNPIGKTFHVEPGPGETPVHYQIVGLVKTAKYEDPQSPLFPTVFLAKAQDAHPWPGTRFVVRSSLLLAPTISSVRAAIQNADAHSSLDFRPVSTLMRDRVRREDVIAQLSAVFGLLAVVLATIGLYGVISYVVTQRRNEIGIRMAVGANRAEILKLIFRQSGILLAVGLIVGTLLSLAGAQAAKSLLFDLAPNDPATILLAILALTLVSMLATLIPARRASRLDLMAALREE